VRCLLPLFAAVILCACKDGEPLEEIIEQNYRFSSGGSLRVENQEGSIQLYGSGGTELHVKAIKRAYSRDGLRALEIRVIEGEILSIQTAAPPKRKWMLRDRSGTIDYVITLPAFFKTADVKLISGEIFLEDLREGSVKARVINGRIRAQDCFISVDCDARRGAIDFYYNRWETVDYTMNATSPNGSIGLYLPRLASFVVEAETKTGAITGDVIGEDESMPGRRKQLTTKVGANPGPHFRLKSVNGDILIHAD
jgi:hypothetical protein